MRWVGMLVIALVLAPSAGAASTFRAPIEPPTIDPGCDYGSRDCAYPSHHAGIDYLGDDPPNEPVLAAADGVVRTVASTSQSHGFGNAVIIEHRLTGGGKVHTLYGHMAGPPKVSVDDCVTLGQRLGTQGGTGDTENVSLHFEFKRQAKFGPPYGYSPGPPGEYGYFDPKSFIGERRANDICKLDTACSDAGGVSIVRPRPGAALSREALLIRGRADGGPAVAGCHVELALRRGSDDPCSWWRPHDRALRRSCSSARWFRAGVVHEKGSRGVWRYRVPRTLARGRYVVYARLSGRRTIAHFTLE